MHRAPTSMTPDERVAEWDATLEDAAASELVDAEFAAAAGNFGGAQEHLRTLGGMSGESAEELRTRAAALGTRLGPDKVSIALACVGLSLIIFAFILGT